VNSRRWQLVGDIRFIRLLAVLASLMLSLLAVLLNELPNTDAYTYVKAAELALQNGPAAAFAHYQWAHLPLLMAALHMLTRMP
jgi:hypothetical protein